MEFIGLIENTVIAGSSAVITWWFSRKKQDAELKASELDNVEKAISIWRELAQDLGKKVEDLSNRCELLSSEINELRGENKTLKTELKKAIANYQPNTKV